MAKKLTAANNDKNQASTKIKKAIIVESPAKAKSIASYFNNEIKVLSSNGHIRDLKTSGRGGLGVDVENHFHPYYEILPDKVELVNKLIKETKGYEVLLATDPDREGEAIAWHLAEVLGLDISQKIRVTFREITKNAVINAVNNPREIDLNLVHSQEARRILDRIIGFKLTRLLEMKNKDRNLGLPTAGRVQSVALKLVGDKEVEISKFVVQEYYELIAHFDNFDADYVIPTNVRLTQADAHEILEKSTNLFTVKQIIKKQTISKPKPPFTTATFQQDAFSSLSMSAERALNIASALYSGVEINGEKRGLITYMRTDSTRLANEFVSSANQFITSTYGKEYLGSYKQKKDDAAQDAHEAIRPIDVNDTPESVRPFISDEQFKVYRRIYNRALASLMSNASFEKTEIRIDSSQNMHYKLDGIVLVFDGYHKVLKESTKDKIVPKLHEGQTLSVNDIEVVQKFTQPPARFNEASVIKELEAKGIGRPSTYAPTVKIIKSAKRGYCEVSERRFFMTEYGMRIYKQIEEYFKKVINFDYTAKMEKQLDHIAEGQLSTDEFLGGFYHLFASLIQTAQDNMKVIAPTLTDVMCPECGAPMIIRANRRSKRVSHFYGCSRFPACRATIPIVENNTQES